MLPREGGLASQAICRCPKAPMEFLISLHIVLRYQGGSRSKARWGLSQVSLYSGSSRVGAGSGPRGQFPGCWGNVPRKNVAFSAAQKTPNRQWGVVSGNKPHLALTHLAGQVSHTQCSAGSS